MASVNNNISITMQLRPCIVDSKKALFHCWEHYSDVVEASPLIGGAPAGTISCVYAIVEFEDGHVMRIHPYNVKFCNPPHSEYSFAEVTSK